MEKIWILFFLVCNSGSHLTSAVYVRSPEEVVVGNGTTDTEPVLNQQSSGALMKKGSRPHPRPHPVCGVPDNKPKVPAGCSSDGLGIVNGKEAVPHSWPWQVSLTDNGEHVCGGSLIWKNWVVTAAHCEISESHRVILGLHDRKNTRKFQNIRIGKVIPHPKYREVNGIPDYDIALIKLQSPAQMNEHVSPVCLAEPGETLTAGMKCVATGWGDTKYDEPPPEPPLKLQQVCLPLIDHDECKNYYKVKSRYIVTSRMICAEAVRSITCKGDSGGPLVCKYKKKGAWTLVGITSWGEPGCPINTPDVFASVTNLRAWMDKTIAEN